MKISTSEINFIEQCIIENEKRVDGRSLSCGRTLDITFGLEHGSCIVSLGNTRVLGQVSSELVVPKENSQTEGFLFINLEISQMCAPDPKPRTSDEFIEAQRLLERCFRDSKCVDLESLCVVVGSKVWAIRVDVHALNDDGNLIECASIAVLTALAHFRRPDVTVIGTEVTVHSLEDREPISLSIHHMPIVISLALFRQGEKVVVDPNLLEEQVADGCYMIGMNAHQEICLVHRQGALLLDVEVIEKCENMAVIRAQAITQIIRKSLDDDAYKRVTKAPVGFVNMLQTSTILGTKHCIANFELESITKQQEIEEPVEVVQIGDTENEATQRFTSRVEPSTAHKRALDILEQQHSFNNIREPNAVFEGGANKWGVEDDSGNSEDDETASSTLKTPVKSENDSSEEELAYVEEDQLEVKPNAKHRGWYTKGPFS